MRRSDAEKPRTSDEISEPGSLYLTTSIDQPNSPADGNGSSTDHVLTDPSIQGAHEYPLNALEQSHPFLRTEALPFEGDNIPKIIGELWTSGQRQASSLHEISYRACFKPQLPRCFVERYSQPGDCVYDPFMGRGTTILEAALLQRNVAGNDVNPLSMILIQPRLELPHLEEIRDCLQRLRLDPKRRADTDLSMFYHPKTEGELVSLRSYLTRRDRSGDLDHVDRWIRMVATNRLTGHSAGFFSVYTLPPNQATLPEYQRKINKRRKQRPPYRDVRVLILRKSKSLLRNVQVTEQHRLHRAAKRATWLTNDARATPEISDESVQLTVTSPPFLDVVHYGNDNWLRCWFNGIDTEKISKRITNLSSLQAWTEVMAGVFKELFRVTRKGGVVAFEVGEVRRGTIHLEKHIIPLGFQAGFSAECLFINSQRFTKTSNIWGIRNNAKGTNSNRIVVFRK